MLTKHRQPGPRILTALVIVGRGGQHRIGPVSRPLLHARVEGVHCKEGSAWIGTDVIARQDAAVTIEGGILDRLGGQWGGKLGEAPQGIHDQGIAILALEHGGKPGKRHGQLRYVYDSSRQGCRQTWSWPRRVSFA